MRWVVVFMAGACGPSVVARAPIAEPATCDVCEPGPMGPMGPPGPQGEVARLPYRWVDATGAVVTESPDLVWIDPATEYVWKIDRETGEYESGSVSPLVRWYDNTACLGTAWFVAANLPREPFRVDGDGSPYLLRPDSVPAEPMYADATIGLTATCSATLFPFFLTDMIPEFKLTSTGLTEPPLSPWVGPLHLEP